MVGVGVVVTTGAFVVAPLPLSEKKKLNRLKIHDNFFNFHLMDYQVECNFNKILQKKNNITSVYT